jgi:hypothetical protein
VGRPRDGAHYSDRLLGAWRATAKTGVPKVAGQLEWPAYDAKTDLIMDFSSSGPTVGPDSWHPRLDLAEGVSNEREAKAAH